MSGGGDARRVALTRLARRTLEGAGAEALAGDAIELLRGIEQPERARELVRVLVHAGDERTPAPGDDPFLTELLALVATARDAKDAEARYREMLERASDGIYIIDSRGRYVDVNASGARMLGFTRDELCRLSIADLVDPNDPPVDIASVRAGKSIVRLRHIRRSDGSFMLAELASHMLPDGTIFGIARDATERVRAERELRDAAVRFSHALRAARAGAWEWRIEGDDAYWSEENYLLMGLEPGNGHESYGAWIARVHPDDRDALEERIDQVLAARTDFDLEYRIVRADGPVRWVRAVGQPNVGPEGALESVYGIQLDVTERKEAELNRAAAEARLHQAHRMEAIGRLAGGIAHDFNNLLTVILAAADVVFDQLPPDTPIAEHLDAVRQAASRGAALTRQLLVLSRHDPPTGALLDVSAQVRRLIPILRRVLSEDVEIRAELADDLRLVRMDPSQLDQIALNLAINARDAMPDGGHLVFTTAAGEGGSVVLTVADDGAGMSEETRLRAFEPFFTTKPEGSGTGLGLATVYGIVTQRGGTIGIESGPGRGTTIRIELPGVDAQAPEEAAPSPIERAVEERALVLVVEDEPAVRRIVRRILESAGHRVIEAAGGEEALALARAADRPIDAVVSDVVMPGMSGPELTKHMRAEHPGVAVLLMSGYLGDVLVRHGVAPDIELLEKPFAPTLLLEALSRALGQSRRSAPTSSS